MNSCKRNALILLLVCQALLGIRAGAQCNAAFTYQQYGSGNYVFTASEVQQPGYTYFDKWYLNGAVVSTVSTYSKTFNVSGYNNICHTISIEDSTGHLLCTDSTCTPVQVQIAADTTCMSPPAFTYSSTVQSLTLSFNAFIIDYTNVSLLWRFGDGTTAANIAAPTHTYPAYNTDYVVWLIATDTLTHCTDSTYMEVWIDSLCQLNAAFNFQQQAYNAPYVTLAIDSTPGIAYQLLSWNFGDGDSTTSYIDGYQFPSFGTYNVCLTLTDTIHGCNSSNCLSVTLDTCNTQMEQIQVNVFAGEINVNCGAIGLENLGITPTTAVWSFGDDSTTQGIYANHTYSVFGQHACCFSAQVPGCAAFTVCDTITINCSLSPYFSVNEINSQTEEFTASAGGDVNAAFTWIFGDSTTGAGNYPEHVYAQPGYYDVCLYISDSVNGCKDTFCHIEEWAQWNDTICGYVFVDANLNGIDDSSDVQLANADINITSYVGYQVSVIHAVTDSTGHYTAVVPANASLTIQLNYSGISAYTLPYGGYYDYYEYTFIAGNSVQCGFDFGITTQCALISGVVYNDLSNDSTYYYPDPAIQNQMVNAGGQYVITDAYGTYNAITPVGLTDISTVPWGYYAGFAFQPSLIQVNAATPGHTYSGNNFRIHTGTTGLDLAVDIFPTSPVSILNQPQYQMLVSNISPVLGYYQANIIADTALTFNQYQSSGFSATNAVTHDTYWLDNLQPYSQKLYSAGYFLSPDAVINQDIYDTAIVIAMVDTDVNLFNDTAYCHQVVVSSFDPNGKTSGLAGLGPQGYIKGNETIDYVMDFQNTGTSSAINIIVTDALSPNLDLTTFRFLGSSRNCDLRITGDTLYFRFSQIMLLPALASDTGSKGWVAFAIKPKSNLPGQTRITNTASIYFDHNTPVITNTTLHTIVGPLGIIPIYNEGTLSIYPNPATDQLFIKTENIQPITTTIYDLNGRIIYTMPFKPVIDINQLSSGVYFIEVTSTEGVARKKFMKM